MTAVGFNSPLHDCKAEPCSARLARSALIDSVETLKNVRLMFLRNARSTVLHLNNCRAARLAYSNRYQTSARRILDRVVDDVHDGLPNDHTVSVNGYAHVPINGETLALFLCEHFH